MHADIKPNRETEVWRLRTDSGKKWFAVSPGDLTYFYKYFQGKPMPTDWQPPPLEILGKSKKAPDFASWLMAGIMLVSERVVNVLKDWHDLIQFLPVYEIKKKKYYAMNVIRLEYDVLDIELSDLFYADEEKKYLTNVKKAYFKQECIEALPPIFKLAIDPGGDIYVKKEFCEIVVKHQFTGLSLSDPRVNILNLIVKGLPTNVYSGIAE